MTEATRRGFLTTAGLGAAAAIAVTGGRGVVEGQAQAADAEPKLPADAQGDLVAYVRDVRKGELALMVEGHEVTVTDKRLVTRLIAAFAKARG